MRSLQLAGPYPGLTLRERFLEPLGLKGIQLAHIQSDLCWQPNQSS